MLHDSRAKFVRVLTFFSFIHYEDDHARKPDDEKKNGSIYPILCIGEN